MSDNSHLARVPGLSPCCAFVTAFNVLTDVIVPSES
jgi:hypothetical protein